MAAFKHLSKHPISIVTTLVCALGVFVVDPGENDDFARRVVAEKKPVLLKELGPEPMLVIVA